MKLAVIGSHPAVRRTVDLAMKFLPIAGLVTIAAYISAQQAVSPQRRVIKLAVLLGLMALILRFDMVYAIYLFTVLFPFPSGVALGSTNVILMTIIPLIWAVRATSTKQKFFLAKTSVDFPIILFLFAHVLAFINVRNTYELVESFNVVWRTIATVMYFYMIVTFVNDEKKIITLTKVLCVVCSVVMLTAVLELFFPGVSIIPGWIGLRARMGEGLISARIEGMRVGGAFGSHGLLSDFGTQVFFLLVYHTIKTRNPLEKTIWLGLTLLTVVAVMATANRGAFIGFVAGLSYLLYLFRKQVSTTRIVVAVGVIAALFAGAEFVLTRFTVAESLTSRFVGTEFQGIVPDTRKNTWKPALERSLEHPFVGWGPFYNVGEGLEKKQWPHNGYIFYLHTIGIFGLLAFLAVIYRVWKNSSSYNTPGTMGTDIGDISRVLRVILTVILVEQLRTDHQRDDIYPFIVWLWFGLVTATSLVINEKFGKKPAIPGDLAADGGSGERGTAGGRGRRRAVRPGRIKPPRDRLDA
jgi:O-antigen ligase